MCDGFQFAELKRERKKAGSSFLQTISEFTKQKKAKSG